mgnify:CR=1 FL=1
MSIRVGINGFGRIGRNFLRAAKQRGADIDFVAANDLGSKELMAHLLKYDTILGTWDEDVALKALHPHLLSSDDARSRFMREASGA